MNMSFIAGSIGAISQLIVPFGDIVQVILHIIIGIAMPGMPIIDMPAIIGFIIIGFIMPGIPPIIGIGMGIIGIICIAVFMALSIVWDEFASSADLESRITMLITQSRILPSLRFPPTSQLQRQQNSSNFITETRLLCWRCAIKARTARLYCRASPTRLTIGGRATPRSGLTAMSVAAR
ncbi:hypothetical protein KQX63_11900 [Rhodopseudomonas palustris]|uniref:hypothetical protein n=1 Tax=Rhodopseudomonas palustris TaxID=1076 RepID=UPI0021F30B47|nr:hypothetical protein [Rhodopseudomonas palustris]UYO46662.1 hypothetical protein KQX63_11900 [Rhodopseudomonas palustris]